jgi:hypothetical protein
MMHSIDFFNEYVEKHSQKAMYEFLGVDQTTVSNWKRRGRMSAAATVQIGVELGYDVDLCTQIALIEAEQSERGKKSLWEIFARRAGATAMVALAIGATGVATEVKAQDWRARLGSNQQPLPSEGSTLSIELRARCGLC